MPWTIRYFYRHWWALVDIWPASDPLPKSFLRVYTLVPTVIGWIHHKPYFEAEICMQGLYWKLLLESTLVGKQSNKIIEREKMNYESAKTKTIGSPTELWSWDGPSELPKLKQQG